MALRPYSLTCKAVRCQNRQPRRPGAGWRSRAPGRCGAAASACCRGRSTVDDALSPRRLGRHAGEARESCAAATAEDGGRASRLSVVGWSKGGGCRSTASRRMTRRGSRRASGRPSRARWAHEWWPGATVRAFQPSAISHQPSATSGKNRLDTGLQACPRHPRRPSPPRAIAGSAAARAKCTPHAFAKHRRALRPRPELPLTGAHGRRSARPDVRQEQQNRTPRAS